MVIVDDSGLEVLRKAAKVITDTEYQLRTSGEGTFRQSGLSIAFWPTCMDITDVATPLPAAPLASRNSMKITNLSPTDTLYVGNSDVTADRALGNTAGDEVGPGESYQLDITGDIILYGRCESGKTIRVKIVELA